MVQDRRASVVNNAEKQADNVQPFSTDNYNWHEKNLKDTITREYEKKTSTIQNIVLLPIIILGIICIAVIVSNNSHPSAGFNEFMSSIGPASDALGPISIIFSVVFTVAMAVYSRVENATPFDGLDEWFSIGGFLFFCFCLWVPFFAFLITFILMWSVSPILAALPVIMGIAMIVGRMNVNEIFVKRRKPTPEEESKLREAEALDRKNAIANADFRIKARREALAKIEDQVCDLDTSINKALAEIAQLNTQIAHNSYLSAEDVGSIDEIIWFLETHRADSIKEALHYVDANKRERAKEALAAFNRRMQEIQDRARQEQLEYQRNLDRLQKQQHQEQLMLRIDQFEQDVKYYNKYGWDNA